MISYCSLLSSQLFSFFFLFCVSNVNSRFYSFLSLTRSFLQINLQLQISSSSSSKKFFFLRQFSPLNHKEGKLLMKLLTLLIYWLNWHMDQFVSKLNLSKIFSEIFTIVSCYYYYYFLLWLLLWLLYLFSCSCFPLYKCHKWWKFSLNSLSGFKFKSEAIFVEKFHEYFKVKDENSNSKEECVK